MTFENPLRVLPTARTIRSESVPIVEAQKLGLAQFRHTFQAPGSDLSFADIGCGSGVMAVHLGKFFPSAKVFAWDLNTETFGREFKPQTNNITLQKTDILRGLPAESESLHGTVFSMVSPLISDEDNKHVFNEIVRCSRDRALAYVVNTHHAYQSLIARTLGLLKAGDLAPNQTLHSEHSQFEYSAERFLRGELVIPEIMKAAGLQIRAIVDVEGTSATLRLLSDESDRLGTAHACAVMRAYICQVRK
jgi:SAM-dependent methyltransferase